MAEQLLTSAHEVRVLSFGAGVQTTALAILNVQGEVMPPAQVIVFADTRDESPETYAYVDMFKGWLKSAGAPPFVTVSKGDIVEHYTRRRIMPMRSSRGCTDHFKIRVIRRWLRSQGIKDGARVQLGISIDEWKRVRGSGLKWVVNEHPLIDLSISRIACKQIIEAVGLPLPPKSGCMCCPWQSPRRLAIATAAQPERIERVAVMEERTREHRPDLNLIGKDNMTVRQIVEAAKREILLIDLDEEMPCESAGYCAT